MGPGHAFAKPHSRFLVESAWRALSAPEASAAGNSLQHCAMNSLMCGGRPVVTEGSFARQAVYPARFPRDEGITRAGRMRHVCLFRRSQRARGDRNDCINAPPFVFLLAYALPRRSVPENAIALA